MYNVQCIMYNVQCTMDVSAVADEYKMKMKSPPARRIFLIFRDI